MLIAAILMSIALAAPAAADEQEEDFIEEYQGYLTIAEQYLDLANRKEAAVFFAIEGIVEIHEARGEQAQAIPLLKAFLDEYPEDQTVRNVIRFKLRDLYRETGQTDLAIAELTTVIAENR